MCCLLSAKLTDFFLLCGGGRGEESWGGGVSQSYQVSKCRHAFVIELNSSLYFENDKWID
jgi:hypothetical protein